MSIDTLFSICNMLPIPLWLLLVFVPRWKGTQLIVHSMIIPMGLAVVYGILMISGFGETNGGGFGSIEGIRTLFESDKALLAGWIHYLVFDLFVGAWEVRDAQRLRINHWLVIPCLLFTLMAGPVGLLLYFVLRWTLGKQPFIDERVGVEPATSQA
ncbi:MAG: ABA4-like family protein [Candidatus Hydrogenedentota bacterium]